jgi:hypothetical protein
LKSLNPRANRFVMKKLLVPCILLALISSCGGGKASDGDNGADTIDSVVDTIVPTPVDKEDPIAAQTKVPKAADGVFYDFISSFCQNSSYQKSRVKFPLPCTVNGQRQTVTAKEWHFSKLYYNSDIYTVFFPNIKSLRLETDKAVKKVNVQWYDTGQDTESKYCFEKIDDKWMLTSIEENPIDKDADNGFIGFYSKFVSDKEYQMDHIAETIIYDGIDPDYDDEFDVKMVKGKKINISQWNETLIPELPTTQFSNLDFGQDLGGDERVVSVESPSSGFASRLHFHKTSGKWLLCKVENL